MITATGLTHMNFIATQSSSLPFASQSHVPVIQKMIQESVRIWLMPLTMKANAKYSNDGERLLAAEDIYTQLETMTYYSLQVMTKTMFIQAFRSPFEALFGTVQCKLLDCIGDQLFVTRRRLLNCKIEEAVKFCSTV